MKVPSATSSTPSSSTRPAPTLSAMAPAKGCVSPHHSWPKAKARLMLPTPSPVEVFSELRNRPMRLARAHGQRKDAGARPAAPPTAPSGAMHRLRGYSCSAPSDSGASRSSESSTSACMRPHPLDTEQLVQPFLRRLPVALRLGTLVAAGVGDVHQAAARVVAGRQLQPAGIDHRLEVARQRGRVEGHRLRPGRPDGSAPAAARATAANTAWSSAPPWPARRRTAARRAAPAGAA